MRFSCYINGYGIFSVLALLCAILKKKKGKKTKNKVTRLKADEERERERVNTQKQLTESLTSKIRAYCIFYAGYITSYTRSHIHIIRISLNTITMTMIMCMTPRYMFYTTVAHHDDDKNFFLSSEMHTHTLACTNSDPLSELFSTRYS